MSDDGLKGLTVIGFVGSVFSPYYFNARKHGASDPEHFCSINVALYGRPSRWAMTERGVRFVKRDATSLHVGPSRMAWQGADLVIDVDEYCTPVPHRLRGKVTVAAPLVYQSPVALDEARKHHWQAVAPTARVTVEFASPAVSWAGTAYHDMNWGDEPLEDGFQSWTWQRVASRSGPLVFYEAHPRQGPCTRFGMRFVDGTIHAAAMPARQDLPTGKWGMRQTAFSEAKAMRVAALEDTPFYTRSHLRTWAGGTLCDTMHESLSLDRFSKPWVQRMLPFRMLRRG